MRGDREVNEIKLKKALGASQLVLATDAAVARGDRRAGRLRRAGRPEGAGLRDVEVARWPDFVVGANKADAHLTGVNLGRDFTPTACGDYRARPRRATPARAATAGHLKAYRGIEVGQVFFLGTKYSKPMGVHLPRRRGQRSR